MAWLVGAWLATALVGAAFVLAAPRVLGNHGERPASPSGPSGPNVTGGDDVASARREKRPGWIETTPEAVRVDALPAAPPRHSPPCLVDALRRAAPMQAWTKAFARTRKDVPQSPPPDRFAPPPLVPLTSAVALPRSQLAVIRDGAIRRILLPSGEDTEIVSARLRPTTFAWARSGRFLAFLGSDLDEGAPPHVYIVRADGTGLHRLSDRPAHRLEQAAFSADDAYVAFATSDGRVVVHETEGRWESLVATKPRADLGPWFAPSGQTLVFGSHAELDDPRATTHGGGRGLCLVDLTTGAIEHRPLANVGKLHDVMFIEGEVQVIFSPAEGEPSNERYARLALEPSAQLSPLGMTTGIFGGEVRLFGPPGAQRQFLRHVVHEEPTPEGLGQRGWLRTAVQLSDRAEPHLGGRDLSADFPKPRFSVEGAAWAPTGRHVALALTIEGDRISEGEGEGVVAGAGTVLVDLEDPRAAPVAGPCGTEVRWAALPP